MRWIGAGHIYHRSPMRRWKRQSPRSVVCDTFGVQVEVALDDIELLRARHAHLMNHMEAPPACPPDWGAVRVVPEAIEFWCQAPDRMHDRLLYERTVEGWRSSRLAP